MTGADPVSTLRLASARRRAAAFLGQVDDLLASSFPHPDARSALEHIAADFRRRSAMFSAMPPSTVPEVVDEVCTNLSLAVKKYTPVLGFILRSTNVRNAFELHFPLSEHVRRVVDADARLILSSEWDFEPLTYPQNIECLPDHVLIGVPATESNNVLIMPLAGHEIGHSVWRKHGFRDPVKAELATALKAARDADPEADAALRASLVQARFTETEMTDWCMAHGLRQLEELFCDACGVWIFGTAYLYAFDYFLAPGGYSRAPYYPAEDQRIRYLRRAIEVCGVSGPFPDVERWGAVSETLPVMGQQMLRLTDDAVARCAETVLQMANERFASSGVAAPAEQEIERVLTAFKKKQPDALGAGLGAIVTAGWQYLVAAGGLAAPEQQGQYAMLNELMLKSIEVYEYRVRGGLHA